MISLVTTRKRKDVDCAKSSSNEKSKVRLIEHSDDGHVNTGKLQRVRAFNNIRRGGVKIMSMFRNTKGISEPSTILWCWLTLHRLCS
jgi:hypothetical protein